MGAGSSVGRAILPYSFTNLLGRRMRITGREFESTPLHQLLCGRQKAKGKSLIKVRILTLKNLPY